MKNIKAGLLLIWLAVCVPAAAQYDFTATPSTGCTPLKVKFHFVNSASIDTITHYDWDFGNGETSTLSDPDSVTYSLGGTYSVSLMLNNRNDLTIQKPDLIVVHHTVSSDFQYYDTVAYNTYIFQHNAPLDTGTTYTFSWDFEDVGTRSGSRQVITFPSVDSFQVTLTVTDNNGCTSTTVKSVLILEKIAVQNVFTPNGDGINDYFMVASSGGIPLKLHIFTRAGILVYEAEGTTLIWDGYTASGQALNPGIYFYTLEAIGNDPGKKYSKAGMLYLFK